MASSGVDQKFLGRLAKAMERDNPFLSQMLFRILGLSLNLADKLVAAKKQRPRHPSLVPQFMDLAHRIIWLAREGLGILEQYVLPWVGPTRNRELIVLACKLRASFLHIYVLFYNQPSVSPMNVSDPGMLASIASATAKRKGKAAVVYEGEENKVDAEVAAGVDFDSDGDSNGHLSVPRSPSGLLEGDPVSTALIATDIPPRLIIEANYLPIASEYFKTAARVADEMLWGSHSLRLSVKTEYVAFLYECAHDRDASRKLAQDTITEVYEAQESMTDDMFDDACELVAVLGRMKQRGLAPSQQDPAGATSPVATSDRDIGAAASQSRASNRAPPHVRPDMENAI